MIAKGIKHGYKVVSKIGNKKASALVLGAYATEYSHKKWARIREGYGPMCVFSNLRYAKRFCRVWRCDHIYKCVYCPSTWLTVWLPNGDACRITELPDGTKLATQVKLIGKEIR